MIRCPKCSSKKDIKWFLRCQDTSSELENEANVITILCTKCGENESFFIANCLESIFQNWSDKKKNDNILFSFLDNFMWDNEEENWLETANEEWFNEE